MVQLQHLAEYYKVLYISNCSRKEIIQKNTNLVGLVLVVAGVVAVMETPVVTAGVVVT